MGTTTLTKGLHDTADSEIVNYNNRNAELSLASKRVRKFEFR